MKTRLVHSETSVIVRLLYQTLIGKVFACTNIKTANANIFGITKGIKMSEQKNYEVKVSFTIDGEVVEKVFESNDRKVVAYKSTKSDETLYITYNNRLVLEVIASGGDYSTYIDWEVIDGKSF